MTIQCSALWVGGELGRLHAACLRSFGAVGVPIKLYVYDRPVDTPPNVELADAGAIVPREKIFRHEKTGSYSIFADMFRYALLNKVSTLYVDVDLYCIRPIEDAEYIFAWEDEKLINNAVLKYPPGSPLAEQLLRGATDNFFLPPWQGRKESLKAVFRHFIKGGPTSRYLSWGVHGPRALTHYVNTLGLAERAMSKEIFYPVHWTNVGRFVTADTAVRDLVSPETVGIHLYNEAIRREFSGEYPASSPIMEMLEGRVEL